jgi:RNA-directed DNA polymerase
MNAYLVRWLMRKYKRLARHKTRAWRTLGRLAASMPQAFIHWEKGSNPVGWMMGAG